jgi:hypothetical protein
LYFSSLGTIFTATVVTYWTNQDRQPGDLASNGDGGENIEVTWSRPAREGRPAAPI